MQTVAITRTGNEEDIIEAFVRHHVQHFDLLLIFDDDSSDNTAAILDALISEGAPMIVVRARDMPWAPLEVMTRMMHLAVGEHGADWTAPLDVDEFVEVEGGRRLKAALPDTLDYPYQLRWSNFAWSRDVRDDSEVNPVLRLTQRMPPRTDSAKMIIPRKLVIDDASATLSHGNHGLVRHGELVSLMYVPELALCHYPIRSLNQFASKCVINALRYRSHPNPPANAGFQYAKPLALIKQGRTDLLMNLMEEESRVYALQAGGAMEGEIRTAPLNYLGGPLKYSRGYRDPLANVVALAETFAGRIAALEAAP